MVDATRTISKEVASDEDDNKKNHTERLAYLVGIGVVRMFFCG
ncbi:hypothetical protein [Pseudomonas agarici]|nr:hypothetical protein [Pseudomonas agarici]